MLVAQAYFGVGHECMRGMEWQTIKQKVGGGRDDIVSSVTLLGKTWSRRPYVGQAGHITTTRSMAEST